MCKRFEEETPVRKIEEEANESAGRLEGEEKERKSQRRHLRM